MITIPLLREEVFMPNCNIQRYKSNRYETSTNQPSFPVGFPQPYPCFFPLNHGFFVIKLVYHLLYNIIILNISMISAVVLLHLVLIVVLVGIVLLAISYLAEFFIPLIIGAALLIVAFVIYIYLQTGHLPF